MEVAIAIRPQAAGMPVQRLYCTLYIIPDNIDLPTLSPIARATGLYIICQIGFEEMSLLSAARPKPIGSTEMIADALRSAICSGEIAPSAPLKQDEIAA